jgi:hypothetical protein
MKAHGIKTLADLTVRIPRRRPLVDGHSRPGRGRRRLHRGLISLSEAFPRAALQ